MSTGKRWTREQDAEITKSYGAVTNIEIGARLQRSADSVKQRAMQLGLSRYETVYEHGYSPADAIKANTRFVDAMVRAIRAGKERPPMIGVHTRRCTRRPKFVERGAPVLARASAMAEA